MMAINDDLLCEFMDQFFGYGNYHGSIWFVGIEEGGGDSIEEVNRKNSTWAQQGKRELESLGNRHTELGKSQFFGKKPKLQPTWNKLIRVLIGREGITSSLKQVRDFQANKLGKSDADHALLELLPLPSPNTKSWIYGDHSDLSFLADKKCYREYMIPRRIQHLRRRIAEFQPKVVLFYSMSCRKYWQEIAQVRFTKPQDSVLLGANESTLFLVTNHPAAFGASNRYFKDIGRLIASECKS